MCGSVPFWDTLLLPALFTVSAFDTGVALVEVVAALGLALLLAMAIKGRRSAPCHRPALEPFRGRPFGLAFWPPASRLRAMRAQTALSLEDDFSHMLGRIAYDA